MLRRADIRFYYCTQSLSTPIHERVSRASPDDTNARRTASGREGWREGGRGGRRSVGLHDHSVAVCVCVCVCVSTLKVADARLHARVSGNMMSRTLVRTCVYKSVSNNSRACTHTHKNASFYAATQLLLHCILIRSECDFSREKSHTE